MPNYTYRCEACDFDKDIFHHMSRAIHISCCHCGKPMTKQFGTGAAPIFRGPGFHCNDYATENERVTVTDKKRGTTRRVK